jgi:pyruvate dehydrogenase E2 component (dihydrolipoamide acetyltransferase)
MALVEVKVPDIGDFDEVAVIELMVKVGDTIKAEQSLITVESDKAAMEIPSSTAGVVKELRVKLGDKVKQGSVVLVLEASGAVSVPAEVSAAAPAVASAVQSVPVAAPATDAAVPMTSSIVAAAPAPAHNPGAPTLGLPHASPSVRKFARELGVPLEEVKGNGPKGRISQDDVQAFTKDVMAGAPKHKRPKRPQVAMVPRWA